MYFSYIFGSNLSINNIYLAPSPTIDQDRTIILNTIDKKLDTQKSIKTSNSTIFIFMLLGNIFLTILLIMLGALISKKIPESAAKALNVIAKIGLIITSILCLVSAILAIVYIIQISKDHKIISDISSSINEFNKKQESDQTIDYANIYILAGSMNLKTSEVNMSPNEQQIKLHIFKDESNNQINLLIKKEDGSVHVANITDKHISALSDITFGQLQDQKYIYPNSDIKPKYEATENGIQISVNLTSLSIEDNQIITKNQDLPLYVNTDANAPNITGIPKKKAISILDSDFNQLLPEKYKYIGYSKNESNLNNLLSFPYHTLNGQTNIVLDDWFPQIKMEKVTDLSKIHPTIISGHTNVGKILSKCTDGTMMTIPAHLYEYLHQDDINLSQANIPTNFISKCILLIPNNIRNEIFNFLNNNPIKDMSFIMQAAKLYDYQFNNSSIQYSYFPIDHGIIVSTPNYSNLSSHLACIVEEIKYDPNLSDSSLFQGPVNSSEMLQYTKYFYADQISSIDINKDDFSLCCKYFRSNLDQIDQNILATLYSRALMHNNNTYFFKALFTNASTDSTYNQAIEFIKQNNISIDKLLLSDNIPFASSVSSLINKDPDMIFYIQSFFIASNIPNKIDYTHTSTINNQLLSLTENQISTIHSSQIKSSQPLTDDHYLSASQQIALGSTKPTVNEHIDTLYEILKNPASSNFLFGGNANQIVSLLLSAAPLDNILKVIYAAISDSNASSYINNIFTNEKMKFDSTTTLDSSDNSKYPLKFTKDRFIKVIENCLSNYSSILAEWSKHNSYLVSLYSSLCSATNNKLIEYYQTYDNLSISPSNWNVMCNSNDSSNTDLEKLISNYTNNETIKLHILNSVPNKNQLSGKTLNVLLFHGNILDSSFQPTGNQLVDMQADYIKLLSQNAISSLLPNDLLKEHYTSTETSPVLIINVLSDNHIKALTEDQLKVNNYLLLNALNISQFRLLNISSFSQLILEYISTYKIPMLSIDQLEQNVTVSNTTISLFDAIYSLQGANGIQLIDPVELSAQTTLLSTDTVVTNGDGLKTITSSAIINQEIVQSFTLQQLFAKPCQS